VGTTPHVTARAKYRGEFFPARFTEGGSGATFLELFQTDRKTVAPKGILAIDLQEPER
jgi:hypothetical protein